MSSPFIAEIRIFPFTFAPRGWAYCSGQILPINQNAALFSLLGTTYGGNGTQTFALPNLQGSFPIQPGQGPGLTNYNLGQVGGSATVTLNTQQLPGHNHSLNAQTTGGSSTSPANAYPATIGQRGLGNIYGPSTATTQLAPAAVSPTGGNSSHNNLPPYLALAYCIALQGIYPQRP